MPLVGYNYRRVKMDGLYNGWYNRNTWLVNLWFGDYIECLAQDGNTINAELIEAEVEDYLMQLDLDPLVVDFMDMTDINYREIAEHYKEIEDTE